MSPNLHKVVEFSAIDNELTADIGEIRKMRQEAQSFLESHPWCEGIRHVYLGFAYPGIVAVFLFHMIPGHQEVDEWVWVIVGDLPPAYITCDNALNPAAALDGYLGAIQKWVDAAKNERSVDRLIPVNVPPSKKYAELLEKRIKFLDEKILSQYSDDLKGI